MSGEDERFYVDPALKVPFAGGPGTKLDRSRLRLIKDEIKENPRATRSYIKTLAKQFIPGMQPTIDRIPPNTQLIVMPSTSRRNVVPSVLAAQVKSQRPDLVIFNANGMAIKASHREESKVKGNYLVRAEDPRKYIFDEKKLVQLQQANRPLMIIDDSISTGESAYVLQRQLSKRGIYVQGVVAAVSSNKYFSYASDMKRVYEKITEDYPSYYSPKQIKEDIHTQFAGFPRNKIADFERAISSADTGLRNNALLYLRQSSAYYRDEKIDPQSALAHTPAKFRQRDVRSQLKIDYPNLNDKQIDRYVELQKKQSRKLGLGKGRDKGPGLDIDH
ncbi:MAG: hypothetical protein AAF632_18645 [Bacteroidota bacterium]